MVGAPACGDVMKLQIKVQEDGTIEKAVFKVEFCWYLDLWMWISHRVIFLQHRAPEGDEIRRRCQNQEHRHLELPETASC